MSLRKIIFDSSTVNARDLGAALAGICADGRVSGCEVSYSAGTVGIAKGFLMAHGRLIENTAAIAEAVSGTGVAQLVLVVSVSGTGSVSVAVRTATSESALTALTQDDINDGSHTTYEVELALVDLSENTLVRSIGMASYPIHVVEAAPASGAADGLYFVLKE